MGETVAGQIHNRNNVVRPLPRRVEDIPYLSDSLVFPDSLAPINAIVKSAGVFPCLL